MAVELFCAKVLIVMPKQIAIAARIVVIFFIIFSPKMF
jgi:hypothetical protein